MLFSGRLVSTSDTAWRTAATARRRVARGAHLESGAAHRTQLLPPRCISRRRNLIALARVLRVLGETDDLDLVRFCRIEGESFANRIFIREIFVGEGLIDDDDSWSARIVLGPQGASGEQRNLHRLEKVFAHLVDISLTARFDPTFRVRWLAQCAS